MEIGDPFKRCDAGVNAVTSTGLAARANTACAADTEMSLPLIQAGEK